MNPGIEPFFDGMILRVKNQLKGHLVKKVISTSQFYRIKEQHSLMFAMLVDIATRRGSSLLAAFHIARDTERGLR